MSQSSQYILLSLLVCWDVCRQLRLTGSLSNKALFSVSGWVRTADKWAQTRVVRPSSKSDIGHSLPNESCIPLQFLFSSFCLYASGSFKWVELEKCFFGMLAVPPAKWVVQKINLKEFLLIWTIDLWSRELRPYPKKTYSFNIQSEG